MPLTVNVANPVYDILVECCGAEERHRECFVQALTTTNAEEYRFGGRLGFGGKFWTNEFRVSCYPEDETPERLLEVRAANEKLDALGKEAGVMAKPKKPKKHTRSYYDYLECCHYLETKYGYDERDYAGKYTGDDEKDVPYRDFWHWVFERHQIHNGCFVTFRRAAYDADLQEDEDWVREIYKRYLDEFADEDGELEMYVWW